VINIGIDLGIFVIKIGIDLLKLRKNYPWWFEVV
jgi:hypothetical protein